MIDSKEKIDFESNFTVIEIDGKYGAMDKDNNLVLPVKYQMIYPARLHSGIFFVRSDEGIGLVNEDGQVLVQSTDSNNFLIVNSERFFVLVGNKWGLIDQNENFIIEPQFDDI